MKRHWKEEELKYLRRLRTEQNNLFKDTSGISSWYREERYEWVPVEKPKHIGYEVTYYWPEVSNSRKNIGYLRELATIWSGKFIKGDIVKVLANNSGGNYKKYLMLMLNWLRLTNKPHFENNVYEGYLINTYQLTTQQYRNLSENAKKHITVTKKVRYGWGGVAIEYEDYYIDISNVPLYEMRVSVKKVYSTHIGIPKQQAWSRDVEIDKELDSKRYWARFFGRKSSWDTWDEQILRKKEKAKVKSMLKQIKSSEDAEYSDL